jgi:hypothetical protein
LHLSSSARATDTNENAAIHTTPNIVNCLIFVLLIITNLVFDLADLVCRFQSGSPVTYKE